MERLHSAKPTGGSIRNIWVWGGQGGFCLQAVHWPDTSPRFSLGVYMGGGREKLLGAAIRERKVFAFLQAKFVCYRAKDR